MKPPSRAQLATGFTAHEQLFSPKKHIFRHCSGKLLKIRLLGKVGFHLQYLRIPPEALYRYLKTTCTVFPLSCKFACFMPTVRLIAQGADGGGEENVFFFFFPLQLTSQQCMQWAVTRWSHFRSSLHTVRNYLHFYKINIL